VNSAGTHVKTRLASGPSGQTASAARALSRPGASRPPAPSVTATHRIWQDLA